MARRSSTTAQAPVETPEEVAVEETTEAPAEATTDTATEAPTEEAAPQFVNLAPFRDAVLGGLSEADTTTGDLPKTVIDTVNKAYREIDGVKGKNQARGWLDEEMKTAIVAKDIMKAKAFVMIKDGLNASSGGGSSTPRPPADPTAAFVQKVASLRIALSIAESAVPEGVGEDWNDKVDSLTNEVAEQVGAYRDFLKSDDEDAEAPEVAPVVRQAFKFASGRGGVSASNRVSGGPRRDIEKHLQQVFADLEPGAFLTVNEIAKAASTEYGDDRPSAGAVSARLFPKGRDAYEGNGIKAVAEDGKSRGAVKV